MNEAEDIKPEDWSVLDHFTPETIEPRSEAEAGRRGVSVEQLDRAEHRECPECKGHGRLFAARWIGSGMVACPKCEGTGLIETETVSVPIGPTPKGEASILRKPTLPALRACAEWVALCVTDLGWSKQAIPELEKLWWEHHDDAGRLK